MKVVCVCVNLMTLVEFIFHSSGCVFVFFFSSFSFADISLFIVERVCICTRYIRFLLSISNWINNIWSIPCVRLCLFGNFLIVNRTTISSTTKSKTFFWHSVQVYSVQVYNVWIIEAKRKHENEEGSEWESERERRL